MMKECPFNSRSKCDIWVNYQIASVALQEVEELCSSNWKEISYLLNRVKLLEELLTAVGIDIPE